MGRISRDCHCMGSLADQRETIMSGIKILALVVAFAAVVLCEENTDATEALTTGDDDTLLKEKSLENPQLTEEEREKGWGYGYGWPVYAHGYHGYPHGYGHLG